MPIRRPAPQQPPLRNRLTACKETTSRPATARATESRGVVAALVYVFERVMPDPFVLSICLTAFVALLAFAIAPQGNLPTVLDSWYNGHLRHPRLRAADDP